jgi:hypothetical protein
MTGLSIFARRKGQYARTQPFASATISDFGGGLNLIDNDLTMASKFAKVLRNWNKNVDGSLSVRWGTRFRYDVSSVVDGSIIEIIDFRSVLVVVTDAGQVATVDGSGIITSIWNDTIASALPGTPDGWSAGLSEGSIDFTEFKGELILVNGVDKPLIVSKTYAVTYLQDPATGSNVNVPIAKYVTTVANYVVMAGIVGEEGDIYISSEGTSGVWPGDAPPNDSLSLPLSTYVPQNSGEIIGLGSFRNYLLAAFEGAIVVVELGEYEDTTHKPHVQDNIVEHGVISHRTTATLKNDFVMSDVLGWHRAIKNEYGLIDTSGLSPKINPGFITDVPASMDDRLRCFTVRNRAENRIMTYIPRATGAVVWTMTSNSPEEVKSQGFNTFDGWDFTCGTGTDRGRVFFAKGTKIYQYGNEQYSGEDYTADMVDDYDGYWQTATSYVIGNRVLFGDQVYVCTSAHLSGVFADDLESEFWDEFSGLEISFDWELPWLDLNRRTNKKKLHYIQADTNGAAQFNISVFVDNFYKDLDDEYDPALTMAFVAGNAAGYGGDGSQPYGGGRKLQDERPWGMPADFKIMKIRVHGSSRERLKIVTLSIMYRMGLFRRA